MQELQKQPCIMFIYQQAAVSPLYTCHVAKAVLQPATSLLQTVSRNNFPKPVQTYLYALKIVVLMRPIR